MPRLRLPRPPARPISARDVVDRSIGVAGAAVAAPIAAAGVAAGAAVGVGLGIGAAGAGLTAGGAAMGGGAVATGMTAAGGGLATAGAAVAGVGSTTLAVGGGLLAAATASTAGLAGLVAVGTAAAVTTLPGMATEVGMRWWKFVNKGQTTGEKVLRGVGATLVSIPFLPFNLLAGAFKGIKNAFTHGYIGGLEKHIEDIENEEDDPNAIFGPLVPKFFDRTVIGPVVGLVSGIAGAFTPLVKPFAALYKEGLSVETMGKAFLTLVTAPLWFPFSLAESCLRGIYRGLFGSKAGLDTAKHFYNNGIGGFFGAVGGALTGAVTGLLGGFERGYHYAQDSKSLMDVKWYNFPVSIPWNLVVIGICSVGGFVTSILKGDVFSGIWRGIKAAFSPKSDLADDVITPGLAGPKPVQNSATERALEAKEGTEVGFTRWARGSTNAYETKENEVKAQRAARPSFHRPPPVQRGDYEQKVASRMAREGAHEQKARATDEAEAKAAAVRRI